MTGLEALMEYPMFDYEGVVTQLGAGSEVADIGISFESVQSGRYVILEYSLFISDQAAGESYRIRKIYSSGNAGYTLASGTLDNSFIQSAISVLESATPVGGGNGAPLHVVLGRLQKLQFSANDTLDADTTMTIRLSYLSRDGTKLNAVAIGSGISISSENHDQV